MSEKQRSLKNHSMIQSLIEDFEKDPEMEIFAEFLKTIPIKNMKDGIAAVSKNALYLNIKYCGSQLYYRQFAFVVFHECLHWLLDHCDRVEDKDPEIWNIATDLVINEGILRNKYTNSKNLFTKPDEGIFLNTLFQDTEKFKKFYDFYNCSSEEDLLEIMNSEMNYLFIKKEISNSSLKSFDKIIEGDELEDNCSEKIKKQLESIKRKFENRDSDIGSDKTKDEESSKDFEKGKRTSEWIKKIKTEIQQKGWTKKVDSFSKPNRRTFIIQNISKTRCILPGSYPQFRYPKINVHIDVSPSIYPETLKKVMNSLQNIVKGLRFDSLHFYFFSEDWIDSGLEVKSNSRKIDISKIEIPKGLGTKLSTTFFAYEKKTIPIADIAIFITDGEIQDFQNLKTFKNKIADKIYWIIIQSKARSFRPLKISDEVLYVRDNEM